MLGQTRGLGPCAAQVLQDRLDGVLLEDKGDDPHVAAASQTGEQIDFEKSSRGCKSVDSRLAKRGPMSSSNLEAF